MVEISFREKAQNAQEVAPYDITQMNEENAPAPLETRKTSKKTSMWVINSLLVGFISLFSTILALGEFTEKGLIIAVCSACLVGLTTFKKYFDDMLAKESYTFLMFI